MGITLIEAKGKEKRADMCRVLGMGNREGDAGNWPEGPMNRKE